MLMLTRWEHQIGQEKRHLGKVADVHILERCPLGLRF